MIRNLLFLTSLLMAHRGANATDACGPGGRPGNS